MLLTLTLESYTTFYEYGHAAFASCKPVGSGSEWALAHCHVTLA